MHPGPHFTLLVWSNGKSILTTPDNITVEEFERIQMLFEQWNAAEVKRPLVIGQCRIHIITAPAEIELRHGEG